MTTPPAICPMNKPIRDQNTSPPKTKASAPVTSAVIWRFAPTQRVNWFQALPWRSSSGTNPTDLRSMVGWATGDP